MLKIITRVDSGLLLRGKIPATFGKSMKITGYFRHLPVEKKGGERGEGGEKGGGERSMRRKGREREERRVISLR